jgi:hypothetical protein
MLVFRDLDYWRMTSNPTSFANHVLLSALTTTKCVFIGLSFRDLNLLRWLGSLASEYADTWHRRWDLHFRQGDDPLGTAHAWTPRRPKHAWLTSGVAPHHASFFEHRGIRIAEVDWRLSDGERSLRHELNKALRATPATATTGREQ